MCETLYVLVSTLFCRLQPTVLFAASDAEQVIVISVPDAVFASTFGVIVTVAELIRNPAKTILARDIACSEEPPMAEATLPAS